jgi:plasmid stabilization system protein ParE
LAAFRVAARARRQIEQFLRYRNEIAGSASAEILQEELAEAFLLIAEHPQAGARRTHFTRKRYRFWLAEGYWVVYRLERGVVVISQVIDARRDVARLLR